MTSPRSWSLRRASLCATLLFIGNASVVAHAQPVLSDDVAEDAFSPMGAAFGPGGLLAFVDRGAVTLWDTAARRRLARIALTPNPPNGAPMQPPLIQRVGFTRDGRLVIGTNQGLEVVNLRDTRQRQVIRRTPDTVAVVEGTADGVIVGFQSGDVVHFGGTPLVERERFELPADARRVASIARVGERTFVTAAGRLFVHSGGALEEVPIGGSGAHRELAVGAGRSGELVVAGGSHLARLSAQSHAVLGNATSSPGQTYPLSIACNPVAQRCYWTRGRRVEVWRDDLSERVAEAEFHGVVDAASGRAVRERDTRSVTPQPGVLPLLALADEVGGAWEPLGAQLATVSDVAWSSRAGELILGVGGLAYALRLADLTLTPISDTRAPVAVGSDGRVLTTGPLGEVIVHSAELVEQRAILASTCDVRRLEQLDRVDTEAAWAAVSRLERACLDTAPSRLAAAPTGTVLAMTTANGDVRWLDYGRGRWLERVANFTGLGVDTNVLALTWAAGADAVEARVGTRRWVVSRQGTATSSEDTSGAGGASAAITAPGSPELSARAAEGRLVIRRTSDGAELTLTFVTSHPTPLLIASVGSRFWAAPEAHRFVHLQASPNDLLAVELPRDSALDVQLISGFLGGR